jgi:hypothetical protein
MTIIYRGSQKIIVPDEERESYLVRSTADEHEREAASAGHVASCCGRADV